MTIDRVDITFIPSLPKGPLDAYRDTATFDWKKLKICLEDAEIIKIKVSEITCLRTLFCY